MRGDGRRALSRIEDYALIGDTHSAALVSLGGSIDWLCLPRFDSPSCFGALLDEQEGGRWRIAPQSEAVSVRRSYRPNSLVLETIFDSPEGSVRLTDCLPLESGTLPDSPREIHTQDVIVRVVDGLSGSVPMGMDFSPRFDYGHIVPWFTRQDNAIEAVGGPDALRLAADASLTLEPGGATADFVVKQGDRFGFIARYHSSHVPAEYVDIETCHELIDRTDKFWRGWTHICDYTGEYRDEVLRSLLTLKALTYSPTGGIVAAATTSLPEAIGGVRNWDYRYCWLRDATFTLDVLLEHGYTSEAREWRDWLHTAVAGDPDDLQIMYGVMGERRLVELELGWLAGYEGSKPVRVGNAAVDQFQLDVHGEVMDSMHSARRAGIATPQKAWDLEKEIIEHVCAHWQEPDEGIWEVRSGRRHFVHSKVMAWVALDRAVSAVEMFGLNGPVERWKRTSDHIKEEVMAKGVGRNGTCFVRAFGADEMDASLLVLPLVGFVDANEAKMQDTIDVIQKELMTRDGLVRRYNSDKAPDGLPPGEGMFLLCSFWLVDCLVLLDRRAEAKEIFERLLALCNDVGLLAEQYDPQLERQVGNFPQAFSHVALATSARFLSPPPGSASPLRRGLRQTAPKGRLGL
ncbi:MAG: glycoside hydrolase family 15 protein [Actinobacteria bacterium]|nr:glycoside hydrolase family 15 protein [Actinomycetota bacterium]